MQHLKKIQSDLLQYLTKTYREMKQSGAMTPDEWNQFQSFYWKIRSSIPLTLESPFPNVRVEEESPNTTVMGALENEN